MSNVLDSILKQYESNKSGTGTEKKKTDLRKYFAPFLPKGESSGERTVRILPPEDGASPFTEAWFHEVQIDGKWQKLYDPGKNDNERSPITEVNEALLMTGSRSQLTNEIILPSLIKGLNVVADRYYDSTLAYQGGGRELDLEWLIKLNHFATYNLDPNITFFIDIDPKEAQKRKNQEEDRIERAGIDLQARVRNAYIELAQRFKERYVSIDGNASVNTIHEKIINEIKMKQLIK